jgi:hypothetical protein
MRRSAYRLTVALWILLLLFVLLVAVVPILLLLTAERRSRHEDRSPD